MFDVIAPSCAFSVDTSGLVWPCGHNVRNPRMPGGTTVTLNTFACSVDGMPHPLELTATSSDVMGG
jgi:hypothetical protein